MGSHGPEIGESYRLSLWLKADTRSEASQLDIKALDAEGVATGNWHAPLTARNEWRRVEVTLTIPMRTVRLLVAFELTGPCKAWVDDVALEKRGSDGTHRTVMQQPILSAEHRLAEQWIPLYHGEGRPYLLFGRMLHPPRLVAEKTAYATSRPINARVPMHVYGSGSKIPAILHNAFRAPDGSEAVVAVNITDEPQTSRLHWHGKLIDLRLDPWEVVLVRL